MLKGSAIFKTGSQGVAVHCVFFVADGIGLKLLWSSCISQPRIAAHSDLHVGRLHCKWTNDASLSYMSIHTYTYIVCISASTLQIYVLYTQVCVYIYIYISLEHVRPLVSVFQQSKRNPLQLKQNSLGFHSYLLHTVQLNSYFPLSLLCIRTSRTICIHVITCSTQVIFWNSIYIYTVTGCYCKIVYCIADSIQLYTSLEESNVPPRNTKGYPWLMQA